MEKLTNYTEYSNLTEAEKREVDLRAAQYKQWQTINGMSMEQYMNNLKDHICAINSKLNEMDEKKKFKTTIYETKTVTTLNGLPEQPIGFVPIENQSEVENLKQQMSSLKSDLAEIKELLLKK